MPKAADETSAILDEKNLDGDYVLRLVQTEDAKNNVRLCLSVRGQITSTVFGGEVAFEIKPELQRHYFKTINTSEQFFHFSERLRKALVDLLKA